MFHLLKKICVSALTFVLLAGGLAGCTAPSVEPPPGWNMFSSASGSAQPGEPEETAEEAFADFPRFTDRVVTRKDHLLTLSNDGKNEYAFVYTLTSDGVQLYRSPKLRPGESEAWDILQYCPESCSLNITITAYSLSDDREQNSVTQVIQLSLPEPPKSATPGKPAGSAEKEAAPVQSM